MGKLKNISLVVVLVLVVIVVLQNTESVETRLLFATLEMPRALLLFSTLVLGVIVGVFVGMRLGKGRG